MSHARTTDLPTQVVAVWAPSGGHGRTSVALALAVAAQQAGRTVVLVDVDEVRGRENPATFLGDAARRSIDEALNVHVADFSRGYNTDQRHRAVTILREQTQPDLVIVDCATQNPLYRDGLVHRLAVDGATLISVCDLSTPSLAKTWSDTKKVIEETGIGRSRLGWILNRVPREPMGSPENIRKAQDAMSEFVSFHGVAGTGPDPMHALARPAERTVHWIGLAEHDVDDEREPA